MARSLWIGTLVVVLGSAWLALGQSGGTPSATPPAGPPERIITVQEDNRPAQKCKVLKTWLMNDGAQALQVQALDTGELMTIVEEGGPAPSAVARGDRVRTLTTRIFHWGGSKTPPPGVPLPPPTVTVKGPPPSTAPVVVSQPAPKAQKQPVVQAPRAPAPATGGLVPAISASSPRNWPAAHGDKPEVVAGRSDPTATMPPPPLPALSAVPRVANRPVPTYLTPPAQTPQQRPDVVAEKTQTQQRPDVVAEKTTPGETGLLGRIFGGPAKAAPAVNAKAPVKPTLEPAAVAQAKPVKTALEPAQPTDWRQSWGKVETKTDTAVKSDITRTEARQPEKKASPKTPAVTKPLPNPTSPAAAASAPPVPRTPPPRADVTLPDPLKEPANFIRKPIELPELPPVAPKIETPPPPPPAPQPSASLPVPAGAGSVLAAGDVRYVPVPIVTAPNVLRMPQQPPSPNVPQAPQPNQQVLANAHRMGAFGAPSNAKPGEMLNAFTPAPPEDDSALGTAFPEMMAGHPGMMHPAQMQAMQMQAMQMHAMMMARGMGPMPPTAPPVMLPPVQAVAYQGVPQSVVQAVGTVPDMQQALALLRDSVYPSQREWAADKLSSSKWQTSPHVVQALVAALKDDPAPSVRAACVRSLAKMDANALPVLQAIEALKADPDESVRREAELALSSMATGKAASGVVPAGGVLPLRP